jgi:thiamine-phosphate diphosphorylase
VLPRLHVVTDDAVLDAPGFEQRARAVLERGGARLALHVRGRHTSTRRLYTLAAALREAAAHSRARLFVNDRVDVALACDADGVQLGRASLPVTDARTMIGHAGAIGYSAHTADEAASAVAAGADFVVFGSVWPTATHPDRPAAGTSTLEAVAAGARAPVVAIGGVTPDRVAAAAAAGAFGVAIVSGVWHSADAAAATRMYLNAVTDAYATEREEE